MMYLLTTLLASLLALFGFAPPEPGPLVSQTSRPSAPASTPFVVQILFGFGEPVKETWTGTLRVENAQVGESKGWLLNPDADQLSLQNFSLEVYNSRGGRPQPKGIILRGISTSAGRIKIRSSQGDFSFSTADLATGVRLEFLQGRVRVEGLLPVAKLTDDSRDDDFPSIAVQDEHTAWAVWQSYSGQQDQVRLAYYRDEWKTFTPVPGVSGDVWKPQVALDARQRPWVVWSQQVNGNFDLYARALDPATNRWQGLIRLTVHPNPDIDHHLISDRSGNLWVVWQGFRDDNSDIFLRKFDGEQWQQEIRITDSPGNDWEPQVAADGMGRAYVVWDSYRNGNYDVYLRKVDGRELGPEIAVAETPRFEAHATVAVDGEDRVWVAWDEGEANWGKDSGPTDDPDWLEKGKSAWDEWFNEPSKPGARLFEKRRLQVAVFDGEIRKLPAADIEEALARAGYTNHDIGRLLVDPVSGRIALLFHRWNVPTPSESIGLRTVYWDQAVIFYQGDSWSRVVAMPESTSRPSARSGAAFGPDGSLWVAWPTDGRQHAGSSNELVGNVYVGRVAPAGTTLGLTLKTWNAPEEAVVAPVHLNEPEDIARIRSYRTFVNGVENRIVRGDMHRHAEFSWDSGGGNVDGTLIDYYRYMLDAAGMDFGGITDHFGGEDYEYWLWLTAKSADLYHVRNSYTPFYSYERSVQYPGGHRNIFHVQRGIPVVSYFSPAEIKREERPPVVANSGEFVENDTALLFESLERTGGISIPHTTASAMGTNWRYHDDSVEPVVEVFQGHRISYEHAGGSRSVNRPEDNPIGGFKEDGTVWNAYAKGYRMGIIASSDHWSTHISYAMVYTEAPTREAIFGSIKKRHTYGATDNIILDCRMGDYFMGDEFRADEVPLLKIHAVGTAPISKIEVIKDEKIIYTATPGQQDVTVTFLDQDTAPGTSYYYIRVLQEDNEVAWGSPFWVTYGP